MNHTLKNLSRRLVSFRGNSGETWHIPPNVSITLPDVEVVENTMLRKLKELRLLGEETSDAERHEPADTKHHESDDEDRSKKTRAKR